MNDTNNIVPMDDQPAKPQYIENQTNNNCQQFFGPISGCVFAMPGANVTQQMAPSQPAANTTKTKAEKPKHEKSALPKLSSKPASNKSREQRTFTKRGILDAHLQLLFRELIKYDWITSDNSVEDFMDLFSGNLSDCTITWGRDNADSPKYGKGTLVYLFQHLANISEVISVPKGCTIPNILMGHFVDKDGNFLTNLDNGDRPNDKAAQEILEFEKILKANANRQGRRTAHNDDLYDDAINPYELGNDGLHYTNHP